MSEKTSREGLRDGRDARTAGENSTGVDRDHGQRHCGPRGRHNGNPELDGVDACSMTIGCRSRCSQALERVEAVTVNSTHKHFVGKGSGQEGYTSASFHPDDLILGTGTTDAIVKLWDFRTSNAVNMLGHVGPVTAMSFSNNGYYLATAALDGVKLWDIRILRNLMTLSPYDSNTPTNAVEFDFTGSYLAIGGSYIRVYHVPNFMAESNLTKALPDQSETGKVTCVKFGADATYIAIGSKDANLRIFGIQSCHLAAQ
uniref:Pre-mRNA-processing factor 19 n=1 Tax=Oryza glumipatula TaxID=40148 RepID=A0A0D9Z8X9_9ORYZ